MNNRFVVAVLVVMGMAVSGPYAWAHRYIPNEGPHNSVETAIPIKDIAISKVVYHEITAERPSVWFTFDAQSGDHLDVQVGVPQLERFANLRPALAVLGPGLPAVSLPFAVPEGYGGWLFDYTSLESPEAFYEEFTGTDSWRYPEESVDLPVDGKYYTVAFVPSGDTGKLWMAVGKAESFGIQDILTLPQVLFSVRSFHEVSPFGGILFWGMVAVTAVLVIAISVGGALLL